MKKKRKTVIGARDPAITTLRKNAVSVTEQGIPAPHPALSAEEPVNAIVHFVWEVPTTAISARDQATTVTIIYAAVALAAAVFIARFAMVRVPGDSVLIAGGKENQKFDVPDVTATAASMFVRNAPAIPDFVTLLFS